jgi:hypothetical protein
MKRWCCALFLLLLAGTAAAAEASLPTANGLPIRVHVAVTFAEIDSFIENNATFRGTIDVRLRWPDLTLRPPAAEAKDPPRVFRGAEAQPDWRRSGRRTSKSPISAAIHRIRRSDCAFFPTARWS